MTLATTTTLFIGCLWATGSFGVSDGYVNALPKSTQCAIGYDTLYFEIFITWVDGLTHYNYKYGQSLFKLCQISFLFLNGSYSPLPQYMKAKSIVFAVD